MATQSLLALQNLVKRDPDGYRADAERRLRHLESLLAIAAQQPGSPPAELASVLSFASQVAPCYPRTMSHVPEALGSLLETHHDALEPALRRALLQALILLRNRGMLEPLVLLQRCFRLFRCRDKQLRSRLYSHVVSDIKNVNRKRAEPSLNRALQNFVIGMLADPSAVAATYSLRVMVELYRRHVWHDAKTVRSRRHNNTTPDPSRSAHTRHQHTPSARHITHNRRSTSSPPRSSARTSSFASPHSSSCSAPTRTLEERSRTTRRNKPRGR